MKEPTKADLAAAVATLTADNAALRELLAAVRAYAEAPHPADYAEFAYSYEIERRLDVIAVYANGDRDDMTQDVYPLVLADRAKELRKRAAGPVRYKVRATPAPDGDEPDDEGRCQCGHAQDLHADAVKTPCLRGGCGCTIFRLAVPQPASVAL